MKNVGQVVELQKAYLSKRELCKYLDCSMAYVDALVKDAIIPFCQLSDRKILFKIKDVDRYIERCRVI